MTATKLNKVLQTNVPMLLTLKKFAGEYDDSFNPGQKTYLYIFEDANGNEYSHYASSYQHDTALSSFREGDNVAVLLTEKIAADGKRTRMYQWTPPDDIQAHTAPQGLSNTAQKTMEGHRKEVEVKDREKVVSQILHGFMKASLPTCTTVAAASEQAEEAYYAHQRLVEKILAAK